MQEFATVWHAWLTMFNFMVNGFDFGIFYEWHKTKDQIFLRLD